MMRFSLAFIAGSLFFIPSANAGLFTFIDWRHMWPLIFIGLGVILLARQSGWGR